MTTAVEVKKETKVSHLERNISEEVLSRVAELEKNGNINFPPNYSYANAIKSAWLKILETVDRNKKPALEVCTRTSIANALLNMIIQALSPSKYQCYFIVYGKTLQLSRSYHGSIAVTKRLKGVKDVFSNVIYDGDEFEYRINLETGLKEITKHEQSFENINPAKIKGAYAVIIREDAPNFIEIMNIDQIRKAWAKGKTYSTGKSDTHKNFADEMAKKSVINRACKTFFNTSDDSDILIQAIHETLDDEKEHMLPEEADFEEEVTKEIEENANKEEIDVDVVESEPQELFAEGAKPQW